MQLGHWRLDGKRKYAIACSWTGLLGHGIATLHPTSENRWAQKKGLDAI